jgi:DNA-binding GntR family transcriptional regulator
MPSSLGCWRSGPRTALLHIRQTDHDADGLPVMLSDEWHVADAFDLIVNRRAP